MNFFCEEDLMNWGELVFYDQIEDKIYFNSDEDLKIKTLRPSVIDRLESKSILMKVSRNTERD